MTEPFTGPLFIVGMPRSGTKLLRDLLNQHPRISIPDVESHFLPGMMLKFGEQLSIKTREDKLRFFDEFKTTAFYFNNVNKGRPFSRDEFISQCDFTDWNTVFRFIAIHYSKNNFSPDVIWGDKTPRYLKSVPLLKRVFPAARFIHIIRDPRDYCLSQRKIWNKNIFRAADNWNTVMSKAMGYGSFLGKDYHEVYYEELTTNPRKVLTGICDYLGIRFVEDMLTIKKSHEFHGDARGSTEILVNSKKYLTELSDAEVSRIESLTLPAITHFGYELLHQVKPSRLSKGEEVMYRVSDLWKTYRFYVRDYGLLKAGSYVYKLVKNNIRPSEKTTSQSS